MATEVRCPTCGTFRPAEEPQCSTCAAPEPDDDVFERPTDEVPIEPPVTTVLARPAEGAAPPPAGADDAAGACIAGRYLAMGTLGRGGFGVVLRALDQRLGRLVALKLLDRVQGATREDMQRFEREARILASLDHGNIVPVYDVGTDDLRPFIAMKLIRGQSLAHRIRRGPLPLAEALDVVRQMAAALEHAHARGVLHRDIKPSNILEDREGHAILADFGISSAGFLPQITAHGTFVGTLDYLPPEALSGTYGEQSDLYALGAVLHEMLFGKPCFTVADPRELLRLIPSVRPPLLDAPPLPLDPETHELLERLLHKDAAFRPASAAALRADVERLLRETAAVPPAPPAPARGLTPSISDLGDGLEKLERTMERLGELCTATVLDEDATIREVAEFASAGARQAEALHGHFRRAPDDPALAALALSLSHVAHQAQQHLAQAIARTGRNPELGAFPLRLQAGIIGPARNLLLELQRRTSPPTPDEFFAASGLGPGEPLPAKPDWIDDLLLVDDLKRHEVVMAIAGAGMEAFLADLRVRPSAERDRLLTRLWEKADVLLLEARARSRSVFESAIALCRDDRLRERWEQLYLLFRKEAGSYLPVDQARDVLRQYATPEQRVFARCFLFHPDDAYRQLALELLEPVDYWEVVAHSDTPVPWLLDIWRHVKRQVHPGFLKVFFACVRDTLLADGGADRVAAVVEMLKEFYQVDPFHENAFFTMLMDLDERVRALGRRHHLLVDVDAEYVDRFRQFLVAGPRQDNPVEGWGRVPLPIQRLLARRGHFTKHFVSHPVDLIAMETLPHVCRLESVTSIVSIFSINAHLLVEMAKDQRLFRTEEARFALVSNPKAPTYVVLKYIGQLRRDSLQKLAQSREYNQLSRTQAAKLIARKA